MSRAWFGIGIGGVNHEHELKKGVRVGDSTDVRAMGRIANHC